MAGGGVAVSDFGTLGLIDYLQHDARPTFAVDLRAQAVDYKVNSLPIHYGNQALKRFVDFNPVLTLPDAELFANGNDQEAQSFFSWVRNGRINSRHDCYNIRWSGTTVQHRWRIISGVSMVYESVDAVDTIEHSRKRKSRVTTKEAIGVKTSNLVSLAILQPKGVAPSSFHGLMQGFDWSSTPVGPIATWSDPLRYCVSYMLNNGQPCVVLWGKERNLVYNEAYVSLIKGYHPAVVGISAKVCFAAFWAQFEEICIEVETTGRSITRENVHVPLERSGHVEECYFDYNFMPVLELDGSISGVLVQPIEVTKQVVAQRQLVTLIKVGEDTARTTSLEDFWQRLFKSLKDCGLDIPVAALYSIGGSLIATDSSSDPESDTQPDVDLFLEGSIGFPHDHPAIPAILKKSSQFGYAPAIRLTVGRSGSLHIGQKDAVFGPELLRGNQDRGAGVDLTHFVVAPLRLSSDRISAWFILGLNPFRMYDHEYQRFLNILSRQVEDAATSVVLLEREKQRLRKTITDAEEQRRWLSDQLAQQTREAQESELRFLNFAKQAPVGVFIFGASGEVKYANEAWFRMIGIPGEPDKVEPWRANVHPDDREEVDREWKSLQQGHRQTNFEWRAIASGSSPHDNKDKVRYLRSSCFAEVAEDGSLKTVTGILMDMSVHKAHEQATTERLENALEAKRAQENFMDMVSHEMRNPLNAILQCAEEALQSLDSFKQLKPKSPELTQTILEAIDTILYCGQHQKQIIDDVLTISKLDSDLLTLSPTETKPSEIVKQAFKIFTSEIRASSIRTFHTLKTDTCEGAVLIDPSRVLQILINLMGNAIKFLKGRPNRNLTVTVEMSPSKPVASEVQYIPSGRQRKMVAPLVDWGDNDIVYIHFSVKDTGPGLTPDEMNTLFARFKQASPRTHAQYGGSGLGLFISRQLAELHGGEIGLHSKIDQGSTFAFYVSGRKAMGTEGQQQSLSTPSVVDEANKNSDVVRSLTNKTTVPFKGPQVSPTKSTVVLIVEDNLVNQKVLSRQLHKKGFANITANHGEEALAAIKRSSWWHGNHDTPHLSLILCDLEMPVMDGITCVRQIRRWQEEGLLPSYIPIVAITGNARPEQINAAKEAGFDDVVCKPYSVTDLIPLINKMTNAVG